MDCNTKCVSPASEICIFLRGLLVPIPTLPVESICIAIVPLWDEPLLVERSVVLFTTKYKSPPADVLPATI